jgi:hypothetical protein
MAKLYTAAKFYGSCIGKQFTYATMTGTVGLWLISGGPIIVRSMGFMTQTLLATTNTLKFTFTVYGGAATDLCTAVDTDAAAVGQLFVVTGVAGDALVKTTAVGGPSILSTDTNHMPFILSIGHVHAVFSSTSTAGAGLAFMEYSPLSHTTKVSVG